MIKKHLFQVMACAAVLGLAGGAGFQGASYLMGQNVVQEAKAEEKVNVPQVTTMSGTSAVETGSVAEVTENVLPSIVAIDVTMTQTASDIWGRTYSQDASGSGSGIIVAQDDNYIYIATNNHVVSGTSDKQGVTDATKVSVKFNDDSVYSAEVKGTDADADLAVVQIPVKDLSSDTLGNIRVATLGNSDEIKVGEQALAIGNALGYGTSLTVGYISAKDREMSGEDMNMKLIQTDAAINPGNSGGALVDMSGAVIGINSAKYADEAVEGMGFAIPISTAVPIINDIIKSEQVPEEEQGYLGIRGQDVNEEYAEYYNIPLGVYVREVTEGSPAAKAGLQAGDIITELDGREIKTMTGLQEKLAKLKAGSEVKAVIKRTDNGTYKEQEITITLGRRSDAAETAQDGQEGETGQNGQYDQGSSGQQNNGNGFFPGW